MAFLNIVKVYYLDDLLVHGLMAVAIHRDIY